MTIRFKCPSCQKPLGVKDHLAGKKANCPVCKKPLRIPTPKRPSAPTAAPADIESLAAAAFADKPAPKKVEPAKGTPEFITLTCEFCFEEVKFPGTSAGQREPCPECKRILKIPELKKDADKPRDWRDVESQGPSLAKKDEPKELEGAWGTAVSKAHVSAEALVEADAILEEEAEPVGWGVWIKRGTIAACVAGVAFFIVISLNRARDEKIAKNNAHELEEDIVSDALKKHPAWRAELYRGLGEFQSNKGKIDEASKSFTAARAQTSAALNSDVLLRDMILMNLAVNQLRLGTGDRDAIISGEGFAWTNIQKEVRKTLDRLSSMESKRWMFEKLRKHFPSASHEPLLQSLATVLRTGNDSSGGGVLLSMTVRKFDDNLEKKVAEALTSQIKSIAQKAPPSSTQWGYATGYALQGDFKKAKAFAGAKGANLDQFRALLGVASVALEKNSPEAKALVKLAANVRPESIDTANHWLYVEYFRLIAKTASFDVAKKVIDTFPTSVQPAAHLRSILLRLEGSKDKADPKWIDSIPGKGSLAHALAWEAIARHNAQLGYGSEVRGYIDQIPDPRYGPFIRVGLVSAE